ncbi:AC2 [Insect-associated begomovirus 4]|nr:AC2 [Insect-associated begomovirus 4]
MKPLGPGLYKIQKSPTSQALSLIQKQKRPRKITLPCKCQILIHHDCTHGFSHRGTNHGGTSRTISTNSNTTQPTVFQDPMVPQVLNSLSTTDPNPIQPQPQEIFEDSQVLDQPDINWNPQDIDWEPFLQSLAQETNSILDDGWLHFPK